MCERELTPPHPWTLGVLSLQLAPKPKSRLELLVSPDGEHPAAGWVALRRLTRSGGCRRRRAVVARFECCTEGEENTPQERRGCFTPRNTWSQFSVHYGESLGVPPNSLTKQLLPVFCTSSSGLASTEFLSCGLPVACCVLLARAAARCGGQTASVGQGGAFAAAQLFASGRSDLDKKKRSHLGTESTPTDRHKLPRYELRFR